jgi:hypothetical protein
MARARLRMKCFIRTPSGARLVQVLRFNHIVIRRLNCHRHLVVPRHRSWNPPKRRERASRRHTARAPRLEVKIPALCLQRTQTQGRGTLGMECFITIPSIEPGIRHGVVESLPSAKNAPGGVPGASGSSSNISRGFAPDGASPVAAGVFPGL